jgi:hypothetical protein
MAGLLLLLQQLEQQLPESEITLAQLTTLVSLASRLKDDILLAQPAHLAADCPPPILPPSIITFLSGSCKITVHEVEICWSLLKQTIWDGRDTQVAIDRGLFASHGFAHGLSTAHPSLSLLCYRLIS